MDHFEDSEDGKVIKEEDDDETEKEGSSGDESDEESDGDETQQSDDANEIASDDENPIEDTKEQLEKEHIAEPESCPIEANTEDSSKADMPKSANDLVSEENMLLTAPPSEVSPLKRKHMFDSDMSENDFISSKKHCPPPDDEAVIDLSAKRVKLEPPEFRHSPTKPKSYQSNANSGANVDPSLPLDLSQKSSRKVSSERKGSIPAAPRPQTQTPRSSSSRHQEHHKNTMSPSLASLQQKFGGNLGYWYNGGYPHFPHMNYVFSHLKMPSQYDVMHYDKRSLEGWYGKVMPSITSHASRAPEIPKVVPPTPVSRPVSHSTGVRQTPPVTSTAPSRPSTNLPIAKPIVNVANYIESKNTTKGNCIDFKCDCGKAWNTLYELSVHMQDTGHMPRNSKIGPSGDYPKLVRGQDMWLNSGSEQTKQILRCMQCGESFKTLPELTVHMMKTQHYADIFSSAHRKLHKCTTFFEKENDTKSVFKCRVCDTEYDTLDGLANHMVESKHHKKQGWRFQYGGEGIPAKTKLESPDITDRPSPICPKANESGQKVDSPKCVANIKREIVDSEIPDTALLDRVNCTAGKAKDNKHCLNSMLLNRRRRCLSEQRKNGDINHNDTSSEVSDDEVADLVKPPYHAEGVEKLKFTKGSDGSGRSTPSDLDAEEMGTIRCENCMDRIQTEEFVEHVRLCISKKSSSEVIGKLKAKLHERSRSCSHGSDDCLSDVEDEKPKVSDRNENISLNGSHKVSPCLPLKKAVEKYKCSPSRSSPPAETQKHGSALKAMEHFIDNFNEKRLTKSRHGMKARSLLYDIPNVYNYPSISPHPGNNNYVNSSSHFLNQEVKSNKFDQVRKADEQTSGHCRSVSPGTKDYITPKVEPVSESENVASALHSLYKFASMDPRKVAPKLRAKLEPKGDPSHSPRDKRTIHSPQQVRLSPTQTRLNEQSVSRTLGSLDCYGEKTGRRPSSPEDEVEREAGCETDFGKRVEGESMCDNSRGCTPEPSDVKNQYLNVSSPLSSKSNGSALDSLKGLVVKHMEKAEHPLNSLQKLINSTDGNHAPTITSLQTKLVSAANVPGWFSYPNSGFSPNKSHSPHSELGSPPADAQVRPGSALDLTQHGPGSDHGSRCSDSDDEVKPSDLKCDLCGKCFSSKGGCRYHRSKCPQNVPRGMGTQEARIVRTPYMYMPPEHTNKFSKYYEMARELANKSK